MPKFCLSGLNYPVSFELEQGLNTVGRNPTNDLRIKDATVSSFHCELVWDREGILVRDLGSSNGTFVEGRPIEECRLEPGAVLRLGHVELTLELRAVEDDLVRISVPALPAEAPVKTRLMPDGLPACVNHGEAHAAFECRSCHQHYCAECVRALQLKGGETRIFCPGCSGPCDALPVPAGVPATPTKKPSLLGRITQTIRILTR